MTKRFMRTAVLTVATSAVLAVTGAPTMQAQEKPTSEQISLLYSLTGDAATMRLLPGSGNRYAFTLKNPDDRTVWFSDRPARDAGTLPTTGFIEQWTGFGFTVDPPNVAITLHEPNGDTDTIVAVMRKPTITKTGTLKATMEVLSTEKAQALTGNLARHGDAHDPTIPSNLGSVSVFIDDVSAMSIDECVHQPYGNCPGVNLSGGDLSKAGLNLTGVNMSRGLLVRTNLSGVNMSGANLKGANLNYANLSGTNLTGANLTWSQLGKANLTKANLTNANLSGAKPVMADLSGANLSGANLSGANLVRANLTGANLTGANLAGANLAFAVWVDGTTCRPFSTGPCKK